MKLGMSQTELKTLEVKWRDVERDAQDGRKKLDAISAEVEKLKKQLTDSGWSEEAEERSQQRLNDARRQYRNLTEVCDVTSHPPHYSPCRTRSGKVRSRGSRPWVSTTILRTQVLIAQKSRDSSLP